MISTIINSKDTCDKDIVITTNEGFPVVYAGRGCYSGPMKIWSYYAASSTETVHLIYVGRYTSIGENLSVYCDMDHDFNSVYMGLIRDYVDASEDLSFRERIGQVDRRMHRKGMTVIGNDVWIGNDVTIISDVVIGNGAVIGAGSVVTHDIPPYTIYAGNPAVYIRDRFPDPIKNGLQNISWWDFDRQRLKEIKSDMKGEVVSFVSKYEPFSKNCRSDNRETILGSNKETIRLTFLDAESEYPVFGDIIVQFYNESSDENTALIVCYHKENENELIVADSVSDLVAELSSKADIHLLEISEQDEESVICNSDYLLLGRDTKNIQRISYALKYGTTMLSGVNKPIFYKKAEKK